MPFTCFICRLSFEESTPENSSVQKPVSTTKCGHLFHSDCLKKYFESLSTNAWTPKSCPVCKEVLTSPYDVFRVSACTVDAAIYGGLTLQQLLDAVTNQNQALVIEKQKMRRENKKLQIEVEEIERRNAYLASENDRCKKEIDRLKDIAISLIAQLTGNASASLSFPKKDFSITEKESWLQPVQQSTPKRMSFWSLDDVPTTPFAVLSPKKNECGWGLPQTENTQVHPGVTLPVVAAEQSVADMAFALKGNQAATTRNGKSDSETKTQQPFLRKPSTLTVFDLLKKSGSFNLTGSNGGSATEETGKKEKYDDDEEFGDEDELETKESGKWYEKKRRGRRGGVKFNKGQKQNRSSGKDTKDEEGTPLFGYFHCETCNAKWGSSRTFVNKPQTCRYCQTECEPFDQGPIIARRLLDAMNNSQEENE